MTRTFCNVVVLLLLAAASVAAQSVLTISSIDEDDVVVEQAETVPEVFAIFDVYRDSDPDGVYRGLIDSVYFVEADEESGELTFRAVWRGGGRYLQEGDTLVATDRRFAVRDDTLQTVFSASPTPDPDFTLGAGGGLLFTAPLDTSLGITSVLAFTGEFFLRATGTESFGLGGHLRFLSNIELFGIDLGFGVPFSAEPLPSLVLEPGLMLGYRGAPHGSAAAIGSYARVQWLNLESDAIGFDLTGRVYAIPGLAEETDSAFEPVSEEPAETLYFDPGWISFHWEVSFSVVYRL